MFYGDEFCKQNDEAFYAEQWRATGIADSRYYNRGRIDWDHVHKELGDSTSCAHFVHVIVRRMARSRGVYKALGRGELKFLDCKLPEHLRSFSEPSDVLATFDLGAAPADTVDEVLAYERFIEGSSRLVILNNLSPHVVRVDARPWLGACKAGPTDVLGHELLLDLQRSSLEIPAYGYYWLQLPAL